MANLLPIDSSLHYSQKTSVKRGSCSRRRSLADRRVRCYPCAMTAHGLSPILNVSNLQESFAWFQKLGWRKAWDWGDPPSFGCVRSGTCEIFLCENGQGGRGKSAVKSTFGPDGDDTADKGVWMSIWVDEVDAVYRHCLAQDLDVTWPPTDMPWGVRETHVRHPDGHVFRLSQGIK